MCPSYGVPYVCLRMGALHCDAFVQVLYELDRRFVSSRVSVWFVGQTAPALWTVLQDANALAAAGGWERGIGLHDAPVLSPLHPPTPPTPPHPPSTHPTPCIHHSCLSVGGEP